MPRSRAVSVVDSGHPVGERRWLTIGASGSGSLVVVVHTWEELGPGEERVRIISARPATRAEAKRYREGSLA
jgi:uncharacterized DUF497 family protein